MTYFEVANLHKSFGGLIAVNDLCFKLAKGQIVGIIGPNGAGKTTVFNLISGFLQPDRGDVLWKGENIVGKKPDQIANIGISRTFQIVKPFRDLTIYENLKVACYGKRFLKKHRGDDRADDLILKVAKQIGLPKDLNQLASNLGQGELRILDIARILITEPELLLLDEPLSGLSQIETTMLLELIRKINQDGTTILIIEHKLKELMRIANNIVVIDFGCKIAEGTPGEVVNNDEVKKAYLGDKKRHAAT